MLPGLLPTTGDVSVTVPAGLDQAAVDRLLVIASAEPWEPKRWRVADAMPATEDDVLAHSIAWADHLRELAGEDAITGHEMGALAVRARESGLTEISLESAAAAAQLTRRLHPRAVPLAQLIRGTT